MTNLLRQVEKNIQSRRLVRQGQAALVAVSGGMDSMSLLYILRDLSAQYRWKLTVVHFNHQLRGRSSDADEKLVRQTAAALKLPFIVGRADVRGFAEKSTLSIEMAARKLRHEFFTRVACERKIPVVALAHHADDQVELFFLRVLRGAGGEGLAGMKWHSPSPANKKIMLVRPLLNVTKTELREFARENKIRFREDATNARFDLPRNRVRNELLPLLQRRYQPSLTKTILRLMEIVGAEADVIGEMARQWLKETGRSGSPGHLQKVRRRKSDLADLPVAVQRRVLQSQLTKLRVLVDFDLVERLRRSTGVFVSISPNLSIGRDAVGRVSLRAEPAAGFKVNKLTVNLAGRAGEVDFANVRFRWHFRRAKKFERFGRRTGCELFDAEKVGGQIILRHWRPGDRFQPIGLKSAAKLQDLFVNQKISRARRHELIVAETASGKIFWVEELRIGEGFKLTPKTKRCLNWTWRRRSP
ncbi:MAG TPA: tRNA lysidine(34) synthetase TilS [Candidatus Saccharimonadales bacterium]|nr:tRNA lysidine(34) synthetase TilS [Candidatus Saccharimonadales bacterium]